ncbi:DUF1643 domain-containing protein [Enterococcus sp. 669A]|uniref:DUF1643 domain-containing protein n=1 Tax=Candidatus Enterococcus moelleringii TaxID=2815325 RepID=A0ABS3LCE0_9ENTE|nr:DUF1643 domain-containing protein [Enterococcus sp. 669A]MBO1307300.1 DUF1643 domain-containing protein [Enterococcus sp. 669A]
MGKSDRKVYYPEWFDPEENLEINCELDSNKSKLNDLFRFSMHFTLDNNSDKKGLMIILMNPSKADLKNSDATVNRVLKYAREKYNDVYLYNTLPVYETKSNKIKEKIDKLKQKHTCVLENNIFYIKERLLKCQDDYDIILATGVPTNVYGKQAINEIYETIISQDLIVCFFSKNNESPELNKSNHYAKHLRVVSNKCLENELIRGKLKNIPDFKLAKRRKL